MNRIKHTVYTQKVLNLLKSNGIGKGEFAAGASAASGYSEIYLQIRFQLKGEGSQTPTKITMNGERAEKLIGHLSEILSVEPEEFSVNHSTKTMPEKVYDYISFGYMRKHKSFRLDLAGHLSENDADGKGRSVAAYGKRLRLYVSEAEGARVRLSDNEIFEICQFVNTDKSGNIPPSVKTAARRHIETNFMEKLVATAEAA